MDASIDRGAPLALVGPGRFTKVAIATAAGEVEARLSEAGNWELRLRREQEDRWRVACDGLVYLDTVGQGSGTDNWQWKLSKTGIQAISGGTWEPRDPEGYLNRIRRHSPDIDPVAIRYLSEALSAFNARCYLATSVMLGVASERAVDGLARAVLDRRGDAAKRLRQALENPRASQLSRFTEMRKQLEPIRSELPEGLADTVTLDAVADLLRVTRNEAGHPTGADIDEDTASPISRWPRDTSRR